MASPDIQRAKGAFREMIKKSHAARPTDMSSAADRERAKRETQERQREEAKRIVFNKNSDPMEMVGVWPLINKFWHSGEHARKYYQSMESLLRKAATFNKALVTARVTCIDTSIIT